MSEISTDEKGAEPTEPVGTDADRQRSAIRQMGRTLDEWRTKIDELMAQPDLADLDIRDEIRKRLDSTQNVYLAARSRLSDVRDDDDRSSLRLGLEQLLRDLRGAYDAAEAAVRRSRENK